MTSNPKTQQIADRNVVETIRRIGVACVPSVFSHQEIQLAREKVIACLHLMKNTRPSSSSRHLAGFHQYPELEPLHRMISDNPLIQSYLAELCGPHLRAIGLSDITVNRSQQWHKDLLRGKFQHLLGKYSDCANSHSKLFKVIVYLQDSASLQYIPGSHQQNIALDNDEHAIPTDLNEAESINARTGDVVIIDICTTHRGSKEEAFLATDIQENPRILISTVFGDDNSEFTDLMEAGNAARLNDWMKRHKANAHG